MKCFRLDNICRHSKFSTKKYIREEVILINGPILINLVIFLDVR